MTSTANNRSGARPLIAVLAVVSMGLLSACSPTAAESEHTKMPDVAALAGPLADQELSWDDCEYVGALDPADTDISNVQCATIKVPRNWNNPDPTKTWDLRISQAKNIETDDPDYNSTVLIHPGGPAAPGLPFAAQIQQGTPDLRATTNFVSFDQRGIGQSSIVECEYRYDPAAGEEGELEAIATACSDDPDVRTVTSEQTAYDMDFIRHLVGAPSVTYFGSSYGTWLGTWFGSLFPENIDRMVFDSALDVTQDSMEHFLSAQYTGFDRQFRLHLMNWIARNDAVYGLGDDPEAIWTRYFAATEQPAFSKAAGLVWTNTGALITFNKNVAYPVAAELVQKIIAEGESDADSPAAPTVDSASAASRILDRLDPEVIPTALVDAARTQIALQSQPAPAEPETRTFASTVDFVYCNDGQWTQGAEYWTAENAKTAAVAPFTKQLGRLDAPPLCAWWPSELSMPDPPADFPETLVIQSELDALTPLESGRTTGTELPNTSLLLIDNEGAHGAFPYGTDGVDTVVSEFLAGGDRPGAITVTGARPLPLEASVFESWLPLDEHGEHTGSEDGQPLFTDPGIPALDHSAGR
ncbi:alpha/beta fold hydrolase [Cryobacterium lactosi]|uniref:Alpha/beta fold hydrolase n=1 Tax=Cryobacterium lactosi TaxID=1259202 RepID=A0A4V3IXR8_9MICO|nr:alpha/beta fold hydrolase [Cryobacterium lactosi]TFD92087.1 alpha/beta fold hydrolase [Cryobacterium lactosi]